MKKSLLGILLLLVLLGNSAACAAKPPNEEISKEMTSAIWSTFLPENIRLILDEDIQYRMSEWLAVIPKYRIVYYDIDGWAGDLARGKGMPGIDLEARHTDENGYFIESDEMDLVAWVKNFQILKKDFVAALEKEKQRWLTERGIDIEFNAEWAELPNPDIIYTFDNDIINAYYRRENPVEPDWTKTKTYESYEAYQRANPQ